MTDNLISIIVPAFNAEKSISYAIKSVVNQTYKNIEIIVINDASTDQTLTVLDELSSTDERIFIVNLNDNVGVHEARMIGLRMSRGSWIGFVDADDYIDSSMYKHLLEDVLDNNADIGLCSVERVDKVGNRLNFAPKFRKCQLVENDLLESLTQLKFGPAYMCNKLYSRSVIIDISNKKFPWRQSINEDLIVNIGCFLNAKSIFLNKNVYYSYVDNPKSATSSRNNTKAYVEHIKAFAVALHLYGNESEFLKEKIYDVYRAQITYSSMHLDKVVVLDEYREELLKAIQLMLLYDPLSMVKLASRNKESNHLGKATLYKITSRFFDKFIKNKNGYEFIK